MNMEKFAIPAVAGIIEKTINGEKHILLQKRDKAGSPKERGLLEIPAGKVREFENLFDCLKREVFEETGLKVVEINGADPNSKIIRNNYTVQGFEPFYVSQNSSGYYPILIITFICRAEGTKLTSSDESSDIQWWPLNEIRRKLIDNPDAFYAMHITALNKYLQRS